MPEPVSKLDMKVKHRGFLGKGMKENIFTEGDGREKGKFLFDFVLNILLD